jgi:hypothetical protein
MITMTAKQLREAALLFGGDEDDAEVTFITDAQDKLYIYCTEYPEEGSVCLTDENSSNIV